MASPVVVVSQPQMTTTTTTVVTNQRQGWSTGICDCCDDCGICCLAFWCLPCFMCKTADEFGECLCLPLLDVTCNACGYYATAIPPISLAMRVATRERYNIHGSICNDCCIMYWCLSCGWCQIAREMKERKKQVTIVNATTSMLPHPTYVPQPVYVPQPSNQVVPQYPK
ncbi:cornifelin homolog [Pristis pectinata]|uniref:cornifelin homolog n=1 Tax=Pristis pectinata TaxID=685728 RepID=UPI00223DB462|nr:cornifelin homolog [Pristis pectinata]